MARDAVGLTRALRRVIRCVCAVEVRDVDAVTPGEHSIAAIAHSATS